VPPDWLEVNPAEEKKSLHVALELVFEDDPTPRREGDEDKTGEGEPFAKRRWKGERWVRVSDR
jgi:hypothetical protein